MLKHFTTSIVKDQNNSRVKRNFIDNLFFNTEDNIKKLQNNLNVLTKVSTKNSQNEKQFYSKLTTGIQKMTNIENSLSKTVSILHINVELNILVM